MFGLLRVANWLDQWLKERVGWPYNTLLGLALGLGISTTVKTIAVDIGSPKQLATLGIALAFQTALLINQLAQLYQFREERRARRAARKSARAQSGHA
ncbi:MAG TPA: hypothetical protein VGG29_08850 [Caulobacteraceae bacterium]|jgi:hypothetical protein